jgi:hypothetical protein
LLLFLGVEIIETKGCQLRRRDGDVGQLETELRPQNSASRAGDHKERPALQRRSDSRLVLGKFARPHLIGNNIREGLRVHELVDQLEVLQKTGVYGAFVSGFVSQISPYNDDPRCDLNMASMSLVKSCGDSRHGKT